MPHNLSFADIFLVSILRRIKLSDELLRGYLNVLRVVTFVREIFTCDIDKIFELETRLFENIHNLTSSAKFVQAIRAGDLETAESIARESPWAVNGREPIDQSSAAHIAVKTDNFSLL